MKSSKLFIIYYFNYLFFKIYKHYEFIYKILNTLSKAYYKKKNTVFLLIDYVILKNYLHIISCTSVLF